MLNIMDTDWRKHAAAAVQSDVDIEKAFLDQAYMHIQNKATPLMKSPYRVGFEVVHKNDTNTRMVGVFVFRINKSLLMVPTFFLNGNIKGTDPLYRADEKRFNPLTNDWCDYLLHLYNVPEGMGVPQGDRKNYRTSMNLQELVHPPSSGGFGMKYASADDKQEIQEAIAEMLKLAAEIPEFNQDSILRRFIEDIGGPGAT